MMIKNIKDFFIWINETIIIIIIQFTDRKTVLLQYVIYTTKVIYAFMYIQVNKHPVLIKIK